MDCKKETLNEIGIKYNTDKASRVQERWRGRVEPELGTISGRDYLKYYDFFLSSLKSETFTLLELGVYYGASLRMWGDYFPNAQIVGIDLEQDTIFANKRIDIICCDSTSQKLLDNIKKYKGTIKCIIDDCSHSWGEQRTSFEMLFPILESGGYYIVEDLNFGSHGAYDEPCCWDSQSFFDYTKDRLNIMQASLDMDRKSYRPFFDQFPKHIQEIELSLDFVTFIPGAIIFRKV